mmetsp:Transcript_126443/g.393538  ORF Transcript_126443/g.393538 Transcript_126443/m.393538 type:complete len:421 (-) Transcript_126443:138-1400(-)
MEALWRTLAPSKFPNGVVIFCSCDLSEVLHPPQPLSGCALHCGPRFDDAAVREAIRVRRQFTYGVVVVDGGEATLGVLQATPAGAAPEPAAKLSHLSANIASRTRRGGQSAARYSRSRDGEELAFLRKVAEAVGEAFGDVRGLLVGGRADLKRRLLAELPDPMRARVSLVVDLPCRADARGLQQTAARLGEVVEAQKRQETEVAVARFMELVQQAGGCEAATTVCYGSVETEAALRLGVVEELLVASESVAGGGFSGPSVVWRELAAASGASLVQVVPTTDLALRFSEGFGVGAVLRYAVEPDLLQEPSPVDPFMPAELEKLPSIPQEESDCDVASTAASEADGLLLRWLRQVLSPALGDAAAAEALATCAELVLLDESTPPRERIVSTLEMLRGEGIPEDVLAELACHATDELFGAAAQ